MKTEPKNRWILNFIEAFGILNVGFIAFMATVFLVGCSPLSPSAAKNSKKDSSDDEIEINLPYLPGGGGSVGGSPRGSTSGSGSGSPLGFGSSDQILLTTSEPIVPPIVALSDEHKEELQEHGTLTILSDQVPLTNITADNAEVYFVLENQNEVTETPNASDSSNNLPTTQPVHQTIQGFQTNSQIIEEPSSEKTEAKEETSAELEEILKNVKFLNAKIVKCAFPCLMKVSIQPNGSLNSTRFDSFYTHIKGMRARKALFERIKTIKIRVKS